MTRTVLVHLAFILAVMAAGAFIGTSTIPGEWYAGLNKPFFSPPNWVFGPVWTLIYLMIGWVGARKFLYGGARGLWGAQMVFNFAWSPVFFGLQLAGIALVIIALMWMAIVLFIRREWVADRVSALMFVPYLAWVSFATALNAAIVLLN
ncbi:TspO and MBR related proteins [Pseudorhodobacter antarcticus]|jgi:tryptophan-rich sensory protein|uniref:TspO and MBR related proteins n=1 Tax=Pseudorhodobacter antarcticus TaxID=1077947 RepID=A0A1H8CBP4_9RHOB|nr:TspO/MBR family protein [Pseudorhodobacter antarcticus]SEM91844.1 TspO and MBR related proteins [Pseudorhodobacter antarcticus]